MNWLKIQLDWFLTRIWMKTVWLLKSEIWNRLLMCLNYMYATSRYAAAFSEHYRPIVALEKSVKLTSRGLTRGVKASKPYIEPSGAVSKIPQFFSNDNNSLTWWKFSKFDIFPWCTMILVIMFHLKFYVQPDIDLSRATRDYICLTLY
jgi:hypothetical protein